jgi:hypothetical protein
MESAETSDFDAHRVRLAAAEQRLADHPSLREFNECTAFGGTITDVFIPNAQELRALLDAAATDWRLALELIQNVHEPVVREKFRADLRRALHNYLASVMTMVEHSRRLVRGRIDQVAEEYADRKATLLQHGEIAFVQDLRNFTMHRRLPFFAHSVAIVDVNKPTQAMTSEVELSVGELLESDKWTAQSRAFIEGYESGLPLRSVIATHFDLVYEFNAWLHDALIATVDLVELNELVVERNAILTGDIESARRLTEEWSEESS